jgi:uncharacterized membrane protein
MKRYAAITAAGLAIGAAPAFAQEAPVAARQGPDPEMVTHMVCEMGVLPMHGGMQRIPAMPGMMQHEGMPKMQQGHAPAAPAQQPAPGQQPTPPAGHPPAHAMPPHGGPPAAAAPGMQRGVPGEGMRRMMDHSFSAFMLSMHGNEMGLALTDAQKTQIDQLAASAKSSCQTELQAALSAHRAALTALEQGDLEDYEDALEEVADHAIDAHIPVVRSGIEAKALLTDDQRAKLGKDASAAPMP